MVHAFGLVILQGRQRGEGGGFGFAQDGFGDGLEFAPAGPFQVGRVGDLAQQAAPFDDDAVDVAGAHEVGDPSVFVQRVFVDGGDNLFGARAIFGRHAVFQIAGDGLLAELLMAGEGETARPTVFFAAETEASIEIGQIVNQFVQGISRVLERGGDGESVALGKEADDLAALSGNAGDIDETEPTPEQGGAGGGGEMAADRDQFAAGTVGMENVALGRLPESHAMGIHRHAQGEVGNAHLSQDALSLGDETDDWSFLLGEFSCQERRDFFVPDSERGLASVPVGQATHPFGDDDTVLP
ncbi:MAG: hypothetical protein JWR19_579 [Pedosphaera sp.]|nr:hypothetical protein [Pedosphaera sp.]